MEKPECKCQRNYNFVPSTGEHDDGQLDLYKEFTLDFGDTEVFTKKWLSYHLENDYTKENIFTVTRDPETNPIYQVFGFNTYKIKVPPQSQATARIFFCPTFPNNVSLDHFNILDTFNNTARIKVTGKGLGPSIQVSTNLLKFYTWDERKVCKHTVELRNYSPVDAKYSLDMNKDSPPFVCDHREGTVPGKGYTYIHITFCAEECGLFSHQLECLILHHDPIIIKLIGINTKENNMRDRQLMYYPDTVLNDNFMSYMADVQTCLKDFPLFSLSENCLDFGGVPFTDNSNLDSKTLVTSLTNHSRKNTITIDWNNDDVFKLSPKQLNIPPEESALFECIFSPNKPDFIFSKNVTGCVLWSSRKCHFVEGSITVPVPITIRALGHSFFSNSYWIPQLELVPEVVTLPPTIPTFPVFTTFYLQTEGYLPVSFKFLPPKKTNFIIKPMLGTVEGYKVIIAQLQSESHTNSKVYIEQWGIQLNGQATHMIPFYIKGFSQEILAVVGNDNVLTFKRIQTGCVQKLVVPIKNYTQHSLKYELKVQNEIEISETTGEMAPNSKIFLDCQYKSDADASKKLILKFLFYKLDEHQIIGKPYEVAVSMFLESIFSELCSTPNKLELGDVECHTNHTATFTIFNFGVSTIHFILSAKNKDGTINDRMCITPFKESLKPKESVDVTMFYAVETTGQHLIEIFYSVRLSEDSGALLPNYQKLMYTFSCNALYPYVEIIDISHNNFGALFSKAALWEFLNVDNLNRALSKIRRGESKNIMLTVPDCEESTEKYFAIFILKNMTGYPLTIRMKRRKLCSCKLEETDKYMSLRLKGYKCPHRDMLKLKVREEVVEAKSIQSIEMNVVYSILGTTDMSYEMALSHDRKIFLNFRIKTLVPLNKTISAYTVDYEITLKDVCISELDPHNQCFWLYNNTNNNVNFSLKTSTLSKINMVNDFDVITCVNPSGIIEAYSTIPILFKFTPIENRQVYISLPLTLGDEHNILIIAAFGATEIPVRREHCAPETKFFNVDAPILLSENHLIVDAFPTWSVAYRMIFIKNMTKARVIGYSWQSYHIEDVVEVRVLGRKGVLQPKRSSSVIIQIRSFGKPCQTRLQLPCKLLDHTEYYEHKRSLAAYNARQQEIEGQFDITEDGIFYPKNGLVVQPLPKQFYVILSMDIMMTSVKDRDKHYSVLQQMKHCWPNYLPYADTEKCADENENEKRESCAEDDTEHLFLAGVVECIIADAVFSKMFKKSFDHETPLYYSQIRPREDSHQELIKNLYNDPQGPVVVDVLKDAITTGIHQIFQLGSRHSHGKRVVEIDIDRQGIVCPCECKEEV